MVAYICSQNEETMSTARTVICALFVTALVGVVAAQSQAVAPANLTSPWVELHNARVRLLAGPPERVTALTNRWVGAGERYGRVG